MHKIVCTLLLLMTNLVSAATLDEQTVRKFVHQIDKLAHDRAFDAQRPLFSKDAIFVIKINDVDEANTVILSYDDYFNNVEKALIGVDSYVFNRRIEKIVFSEDKQMARVYGNLEETYTTHSVSETSLSQGAMDIGYQNGKLLVKGVIISTQNKDAYSMMRCSGNKTCHDFKTLFPNIASIQTDWLDRSYKGVVVDNSRGHKRLQRDYTLVDDLVDGADCYALIMPPYDDAATKTYYRINDKRTLHKLLQGNASDFLVLQYVDPEGHEHLSDYTLFRNSIWLDDQVSNLTLVIPERQLVLDWSRSDEINIISNNATSMHKIRKYLVKKGYVHTERTDTPSFDMYRFFMTPVQLATLKPHLEKYEVAEENISTVLADMGKQNDDGLEHVLVHDKNIEKNLKAKAIEKDLRLISVSEFSQLLVRLIREMEGM